MKRRDVLSLSLVLVAAPAAARASPSSEAGREPSYSPFAVITASIIRPTGRRGVLSVEAGVDVADAALRTRATQAAPRLRAACSEVLRAFASGILPDHPPDVERLSREMQAAIDRVLGRSGARFLLGTVLTN